MSYARGRGTLVVLALITALCSGCATIMNGSTQAVHIRSKPEGANCLVGGRSVVTPTTIRLHRGRNYQVECLALGFFPAYASISGRLSGWTFVNLLGLIGLAIDFDNGAAFNLSPSEVNIELVPKGALPGEAG